MKKLRVCSAIQEALDDAGLPYDLTMGARHIKIRLAGRMVGICPRDGGDESRARNTLNVVAQIRRAAAEVRNGQA